MANQLSSLLRGLSGRHLRVSGRSAALRDEHSNLWGSFLNDGAELEAIEEAERKLKLQFPTALREFFLLADGQKPNSPDLLMAPKNRSLRFLSVKEARDLTRYWTDMSESPLETRWWREAGWQTGYVPIGYAPKLGIALCVSCKVGRVLRFTSPEVQASLSASGVMHVADSLEDYLADLDDHLSGARQPFVLGPKNRKANAPPPRPEYSI